MIFLEVFLLSFVAAFMEELCGFVDDLRNDCTMLRLKLGGQ